ncbi:MAG: 4Fe-4S binding protein [Candidatus Moduliflexus flocculans]|nr:4Fe-4S binding protein [Candidatus Moduliflexus flocculans]
MLDNAFHFLPFLLTLGFAFLFYRPFCYLVCPIGLLTNLVENFALFRVVLKKPACNDCGACEKKSPVPDRPRDPQGRGLPARLLLLHRLRQPLLPVGLARVRDGIHEKGAAEQG